jgi:hypothetical protein
VVFAQLLELLGICVGTFGLLEVLAQTAGTSGYH